MIQSADMPGDVAVIRSEITEADQRRRMYRNAADVAHLSWLGAGLVFVCYFIISIGASPPEWKLLTISGLIATTNWLGRRRLLRRAAELDAVVEERKAALTATAAT